ncbi:tRNA (cytidine32/uridine32-2'-O)-methyltransferase [Psychrobacter sp. PL15]|uniref:RNA methyltransferase n=1 Tax=Psychrobacter sp. PL15 TaxID=3071719 RepID=UPI002DFAD410|nr:tRNA (cytidine32/uridine32-2'-O)-methyltransferase [Psychrobacter sp. PL15]
MKKESIVPELSKPTVDDYLACLQVVMVNTTLPANIGSAARAMHTMGLSRLSVVNPKHPIDDTSRSHAAGGSVVLADAQITPTLETAISDCQLVFAASSRSRHLPRPVVTPTQAAKIMLDFIDSQMTINNATVDQNPNNNSTSQHQDSTISNKHTSHSSTQPNIAILFGREDRGLTNEELACADYHIQIDANPAYPVLNVASAVQVIASFIFAYARTHIDSINDAINASNNNNDNPNTAQPLLALHTRQQWDEPAITQQQLQQLTNRTTELMVQRGIADADHLKSLPSRLSRLGSRVQLDQKEYQLLSALIAKLLKG